MDLYNHQSVLPNLKTSLEKIKSMPFNKSINNKIIDIQCNINNKIEVQEMKLGKNKRSYKNKIHKDIYKVMSRCTSWKFGGKTPFDLYVPN